jgi:hypothetical protein
MAWALVGPTDEPVAEAYALAVRGPCANATEVRTRIDALIGPGDRPATRIEVDFVVQAEAWVVELALEIDGATSRRRLPAESCAAAVDAAVLVSALAIDPDAIERLPPEEPADPPIEPEPELEPPRAAPLATPPTPPPPPPEPRVWWSVEVGAGGSVGIGPRVAPAVRTSGSVGGRAWSVGLGGAYVGPRTVDVDPGAAARLQLWGVDARGCWVRRTRVRGLAFDACAALHAGAMHGRGMGAAISARRGAAPWVAAGPSAALRWISRAHVGAFLRVDALVVILRPSFVITDLGRVCCGSAVGALFTAGIAFGTHG